ncbi:MAG: 4Fe-4S dicluster domain-containing protein [Clostridia bacterium]|nr:4Fe-4S dicluster domain-containing protein [Clostridiales bacterium]MBQ3505506.1 4Fe-4S dicluster domain-containing protein [Clostridia bacterium]
MTREEYVESIKAISGTDVRKCMKCGKCSGRCPAFKDMDIKPHQFVTLLGQGKIDVLLESKAIWNCLSCMACVERCPRGVAPAAVVEAVRDTVVRMQGKNGIKAEDIPPIVDELIPQQLLVSAYRKYNK